MLKLLKGAECFAPHYLGVQDLLVAGGRILRIAPVIDLGDNQLKVEMIDLNGKWLVPGLVDSLVHITGGGGEGGFASRIPELKLSTAIQAGVTTMVGALGTDSVTRTHSNLIAKARELQLGGISCVCHTGSYHAPVKTLTGSIEQDIVYINEFIGVGEVAISDHRSSQPSREVLSAIAAEARVAGMVSGKAGIVSIHTGDGTACLRPILDVVENTELPITQFYPTHINRSQNLFKAGIEYARLGGYVDLTTSTTPELLATGEVKCSEGLGLMLQAGVPLHRITFSSDGNASLPLFDDAGVLKGLQVGDIRSLWAEVRDAIQRQRIEPEQAISVATINPANILKLERKGRIVVDGDADLLVVDRHTLEIESVMTQGVWRMRSGEVLQKGSYE